MVEFDVGPRHSGVAIGTLGAHRVAMDIVCLVAGITVRGGIAMLATGFVAFTALRFPVLAEQRKVGEFMVEGVFVELHDIGIPAFMIGMTGRTAGIACVGI